MSRLIFAFNFCESLIENNEIIKNFDTCRKSIINNPKNYTGIFDFLPKMADFRPFVNCQQCTGNFGPKYLVLDGHLPKNTPEFKNLNGMQCLILRAAFLYLHCRFVLFWRKEIGAKSAHKMLVKLTAFNMKMLYQRTVQK